MNELVVPLLTDDNPVIAPPSATPWWRRGDVVVAVLGFIGFSAIVLSHASALLEPDDYAYRASIVALSQGHILLSTAQFKALESFLSQHGESGIAQWHHLASGKWISEKNPGYPFFAVLFYMAKVLRLAPLFYGALACVGLYMGARSWLGRWAGTYAVWAYCFSGAALVFAWRATMPTFTDASLIAAGAGGLLWTAFETSARPRPTTHRGTGRASSRLEGAVFIRYTDVAELVVALIAGLCLFPSALASACRMLATWWGSAILFGAFDWPLTPGPTVQATSTGYDPRRDHLLFLRLLAQFEAHARPALSSMPVWIVAAIALAWIAAVAGYADAGWRPGATSGAAATSQWRGVLAVGWLSMWLLYFTYTWTADMMAAGNGPGGGWRTLSTSFASISPPSASSFSWLPGCSQS